MRKDESNQMSCSSQTLLPKNPKIQPNLDKLYKSLKCRKSVEYRLRYFGTVTSNLRKSACLALMVK